MNRWIALTTLVALTVVSRAHAEQTYDLRAVVDRRIEASLDADVDPATKIADVKVSKPAKCVLKVQRVAGSKRKLTIEPDADKCQQIWGSDVPARLELSVTVGGVEKDLALAFSTPPELAAELHTTIEAGKVKVPTKVGGNGQLILFAGKDKQRNWIRLPVKDGFFEPAAGDKKESDSILSRPEVSYYLDDGTTIGHGTMRGGTPSAQESNGPPAPTPRGEMACDRMEGRRVICVDFLDPEETPKVTFVPDTGHVIAPNEDVVVRVRHKASQSAKISMAGERGLYVPGTRDLATPSEAKTHSGDGPSPPTPKITQHPFAPRRPGDADISIKLSEAGEEDVDTTIELVVDQTYSGAVRLGVGLPFLGAKDASYDVAPAQGSSQSEIVSETFNGVDLELFVGYSAYLDRGGRSLVRRTCDPCISPFLGIGVWAPEASGVEFLKSLYLGLEWEPTPNFSVGAGVVARRVTRLRDGYRVGQAVDGTEIPTRTGIGIGLGLVATFSPDFLRIARPAAQSFFK